MAKTRRMGTTMEGVFAIPLEHLRAMPLLAEAIQRLRRCQSLGGLTLHV